jgi:hypothetical protein
LPLRFKKFTRNFWIHEAGSITQVFAAGGNGGKKTGGYEIREREKVRYFARWISVSAINFAKGISNASASAFAVSRLELLNPRSIFPHTFDAARPFGQGLGGSYFWLRVFLQDDGERIKRFQTGKSLRT